MLIVGFRSPLTWTDMDLDLDLFHSMMGQYKNAIKLANGAHMRSSRANRGAGLQIIIVRKFCSLIINVMEYVF